MQINFIFIILFNCITFSKNFNIVSFLDEKIHYNGRVHFSSNYSLFDWSGIEIMIEFEGSSASAIFYEDSNFYNIYLNNQLLKIIKTKKYFFKKNLIKIEKKSRNLFISF